MVQTGFAGSDSAKGPFGSSGFKIGPAKSHPNLAKRAFIETGACDFGGRRFETGATERALKVA
jgi:hypothetical protein